MFRRFFMNRPLKTRITFLYTLFAVVLVGAITLYTYHFTANLLRTNEITILNDSLDYLENRIDTRLKTVNEEFISIFDDSKFLELYLSSVGKSPSLAEQVDIDAAYRDYFCILRPFYFMSEADGDSAYPGLGDSIKAAKEAFEQLGLKKPPVSRS